jgi:hypothetical protein
MKMRSRNRDRKGCGWLVALGINDQLDKGTFSGICGGSISLLSKQVEMITNWFHQRKTPTGGTSQLFYPNDQVLQPVRHSRVVLEGHVDF